MGSSFALPRPGSWLRSGARPFEASTGSPDRRPICPSSGRLQAMRRGTTTRRAMSALVAVGCVAGLGAGVAGCSGDPGPTTTPTPTVTVTVTEEPSPSTTPTPTPTPDASVKPERPAAMDVADSAGAEAAAVYFLQLYPYVYATNDLTEWRELSHPECVFCASVITNVEEQVTANQHCNGGLVDVGDVSSTEVDPGRWWTVDVELTQEPSKKLDAEGQLVEDFPETKSYHMDLAVISEAGAWSVRAVDFQETES